MKPEKRSYKPNKIEEWNINLFLMNRADFTRQVIEKLQGNVLYIRNPLKLVLC